VRRHQHLFDAVYDRCVQCGAYLQDCQSGDEGCGARELNPEHYIGIALTVAEQVLARADGLDCGEALVRKHEAMFGAELPPGSVKSNAPRQVDELLVRRRVVERSALEAAEKLRAR
jgi:hypothetical protein